MSWIKNAIKRFYPVPTRTLQREVGDLRREIADLKAVTGRQTLDAQNELLRNIWFLARMEKESVWAHVYHDTVADSTWLKQKAFSPGRWAVGYAYLYVMYRILNEVRPKHVLDFGLGQTSRMIAQYAAANPDVEHVIVESSAEWIDFFQRDFHLPANSRILRADYVMESCPGGGEVRVFKGLEERLQGMAFDFVSIDAPIGGDMKHLSRVDFHKLVPSGLCGDFAIMMDDAERAPERDSLLELHRKLTNLGVRCSYSTYDGMKDCMVLVSDSLRYLLTM